MEKNKQMLDLAQSQDLGQEEKLGYARIMLDIISTDQRFDADEIQKIYMIFSATNISGNTRRELLSGYIKTGRKSVSKDIPESLRNHETAKFLIAKDIMALEKAACTNHTLKAAQNYLSQLKLTAEQSSVISQFIRVENKILKAMGAGEDWIAEENSMKEITSRAAAIGVPLAALNMAGIAGFGAAGITSGLATIGGISGLTVLGLNPMTAGIGALILGGVAVKKIADYALSGNEEEQLKNQKLLQEARVNTLKAMSQDLPEISVLKKRELLLFPRAFRRRALVRGLRAAIQEESTI